MATCEYALKCAFAMEYKVSFILLQISNLTSKPNYHHKWDFYYVNAAAKCGIINSINQDATLPVYTFLP